MDRDRPHRGSPPWPLRALVLGMAAAWIAAMPAAVEAVTEQPLTALGWVAIISAASLRAVWLAPGTGVEFNLRTPVSVGAAVILPPPLALFVTSVSLVSQQELRGRNPWMIAFNHLQLGLCGFLASLTAATTRHGAAAALLAVVAYGVLNLSLVSLAVRLLRRRSLWGALRSALSPFPWFATSFLLVGLLAVLVVVLQDHVGAWSLGLLLAPMWLAFGAVRAAKQASDRAEELDERVRELEVLSGFGPALLSARDVPSVVALTEEALRSVCGSRHGDDVAVALDGRVPAHLDARPVPGTQALVGLRPDLDDRRDAGAATICSALGLALQRIEAEEQLRESQRAQAALAERILAEGAIARSRVALHVHDDVLPHLAAAQIQADNALTAQRCGDGELATRLSNTVRDAVEDGIRTLRQVLDDLQCQTLLPGDLLAWLRRAAERLRVEHGLDVVIEAEGFTSGLSHSAEILLAESITGLLANIVEHAQASTATLRLRSSERSLALELQDDGVGFDPRAVRGDSHGLALLRQRAALVDGHLDLTSAPGQGTRVRLVVPFGGAADPLTVIEEARSRTPARPVLV